MSCPVQWPSNGFCTICHLKDLYSLKIWTDLLVTRNLALLAYYGTKKKYVYSSKLFFSNIHFTLCKLMVKACLYGQQSITGHVL